MDRRRQALIPGRIGEPTSQVSGTAVDVNSVMTGPRKPTPTEHRDTDDSVVYVPKSAALILLVLLAGFGWLLLNDDIRAASGLVAVVAVCGLAAVAIDIAAVLLLMTAMALVQPFALGAGHTIIGSAIACAAGLIALISDATRSHERAEKSMKSVLVWVACSGLWTVAIASQHTGLDQSAATRSLEALTAVVGAGVLVLRNGGRRLWFARAVVLVMAGFCASYCLTFLLWLKDGFGSHVVGGITVRRYGTEPIYLPFTPTSGATMIHGHLIPRLLGPMRSLGCSKPC